MGIVNRIVDAIVVVVPLRSERSPHSSVAVAEAPSHSISGSMGDIGRPIRETERPAPVQVPVREPDPAPPPNPEPVKA